MIKTILFDLDGTLLNSEKKILNAVDSVLKEMFKDLNLTYQKIREIFFGPTLYQSFSTLTSDPNKVEEAVALYRKTVDNSNINVKPFPYAAKTLAFLKKNNLQIAVVTSKKKANALVDLRNCQLLEYIDLVIGYDDVLSHKPDPEPINLAIKILKVPKEETIYVGDHVNDILASKKAGISCCLVSYSPFLSDCLLYQPEFIVDNLRQLRYLIED